MPTRPKDEAPRQSVGNAVRAMRISTGEEAADVQDDGKNAAGKEL